jgi:hypothetical protein
LEGVEDSMAVAEGFMGVAAILVAVAMDGAVAVTAGVVAVTGAAGTVEAMGVAGTVVVRIGGGVTHTRMLTDPTVGKSDEQKNLNRG